MKIQDILNKELCQVGIKSKKKKDILLDITELLQKSSAAAKINKDIIYDALQEREELGSTALGNGIAIPHAKLEKIDDFVLAVLTSPKGVNFNAVDRKSVHVIFALIGPKDKPNEHLKLLSMISQILRDRNSVADIQNSKNAETLYETVILRSKKGIERKSEKEKQKLMIIVLYEEQHLEDILEMFIELDIKGATVLDSVGMGGILRKAPLFADFTNFLGQNKNYSKTILTLVEEKMVPRIVKRIEDKMGDLSKHTGASIITLDVSFMKGTLEYL
ncbi:MAG: PTS sugar transporter subunit IIA [Candidatus Cloacimonetes bacterium]|nr:PTS sugar transporter subunit IIA [Candidatus Cloacimonadota bacterium]MBS3768123.1 PTS sugar transporter subunit IIA [Candidatus Cloacimonadota bacterium]